MKTDLTQMEEENQRLLEEARVEMREIGGELVPVTVVPMGASGRKPRHNWRRLRPESGPVLLNARIRKRRTRWKAKPEGKEAAEAEQQDTSRTPGAGTTGH